MKTWMLFILLLCVGCETAPTTRFEANFSPYTEKGDLKIVVEVK